jgi:hypothetical protein
MKPLIDCCKEYAEGKIDATNFLRVASFELENLCKAWKRRKKTKHQKILNHLWLSLCLHFLIYFFDCFFEFFAVQLLV